MKINKYIDHTLLKADSVQSQIDQLLSEAKTHEFASVCVNPGWVSYCAEALKGSDVKVCTVVGFPLGATTPETKAFETKNAIENGADEIDMVLNIGKLKQGDYQAVEDDVRAVVEASGDKLVKVIIEACLLTDDEKIKACQLSVAAGADFVKTSTGFSTGGATISDVKLMRQTVGPEIGVKAAGGARSLEDALAFIEAGATRIGTSAGVKIINGDAAKGKTIAAAQYAGGADVIYQAAGGTGAGVFNEAKAVNEKKDEADKVWVIGVDRDQKEEGKYTSKDGKESNFVLASSIKQVGKSVQLINKLVTDKKFPGGKTTVYGLKDGGVDIATTNLSDDAIKAVKEAKEKIISGDVKVPEK